jgi:hypothetical protein
MKVLLAGWLFAAFAVVAVATSPRLNTITPAGAQRGTDVEVRLAGARLDQSPEIVFSSSGIKVLKIDSAKTNSIRATLRIAADSPLGEHQLRVRTPGGVSELRTFWIGALPNADEIEPNNDRATAHRVKTGITINGAAGGDDTDYFRLPATKGERITVEVEAVRLGRAMLDAFLAIRDEEGKILASADDTTLLMQDAAVSILAPKDGLYFIEMRDGTYSGSQSAYRLHIGSFPRPMMVYPLGGKVSETVSFQFIGDAVGELSQSIALPMAAAEKFGIYASQERVMAPSPNWIRVSSFGNELEAEPNDAREAATVYRGELPIAFNGIIAGKNDVDSFRFKARKGQVIEANVFARRLRSPLDSAIALLDGKGGSVASNDDAAGADSVLKYTIPADGEYTLQIRDQFENGGPEFVYRVEVSSPEPGVLLSIPQVARNDSQSRQVVTVPRGGRFATMISAKRANFAGDLSFRADGLPGGVKMKGDILAAKLETQPLVFEAPSDAPIMGRFVDLIAQPTEGSNSVSSRYRHDLEFISGPNNTYYYGSHEERLYVAVCESAPFSIRIEESGAPLVQYGALDLKVVVDRRAGFDEPINVKMMWNPPGVSSLPDITIPKGSNSAIYQLNARADAEPRRWKIAVLGSAPVNGAPVFVSSDLVTLETAEPFVIGTVAPVMVSPGQEARLVCKLDQRKPFEGKARVHLRGLPDKITASDAEITSADKEVVIPIRVDPTATHASYRNFLCAADVIHNGKVILHNLAAGAVIRVVPPKKSATGPVASSSGKPK